MDGGLLNNTLSQFVTVITATWGNNLLFIMTRILEFVTFFQFLIIFMYAAMHRDFSGLFDDLCIAGIRIGFIWIIFNHSQEWGQAVIDTGNQIGQQLTGLSPLTLTPSGVIDQGLGLVSIIWHAKGNGSWLAPVQDVEFFLVEAMVLVAWLVAALVLFETLLEGAVLVYGGSLLIAFSPFQWTGELVVSWAKAIFAIAIKLVIVLGLLAIGGGIAGIWATQLAAVQTTMTKDFWALIEGAVMSIIFLYVVWKVPHMYTGLIGGSPSMQFGSAFAGALAGYGAGEAVSAGEGVAKQGAALAKKGASAAMNTVNSWLLMI